jgi:hypothetical protein
MRELRDHRRWLTRRQATRLSAWFLTISLPRCPRPQSGHVLERVVLDFRPDRRSNVTNRDLKLVAWRPAPAFGRSKVTDHALKLVACDDLFRHMLGQRQTEEGL